MLYVGNDVVDLNESHDAPKSLDTRFIDRVFTPKEKQWIAQARCPELILWLFWSAKETAYKIMSKIKVPLVFSHQLFSMEDFDLKSFDRESGADVATIRYEESSLSVSFDWNSERIHAIGTLGFDGTSSAYFSGIQEIQASGIHAKDFKTFQESLSVEESQSIHSQESEWVRYFAKKAVAEQMDFSQQSLAIIRETKDGKTQPPYLKKNNTRLNVDLSLSHHGKWVAWVFTHPQVCTV